MEPIEFGRLAHLLRFTKEVFILQRAYIVKLTEGIQKTRKRQLEAVDKLSDDNSSIVHLDIAISEM